MSKNAKAFIAIVIITCVVFGGIFAGVKTFDNAGKTDSQITEEETIVQLNK